MTLRYFTRQYQAQIAKENICVHRYRSLEDTLVEDLKNLVIPLSEKADDKSEIDIFLFQDDDKNLIKLEVNTVYGEHIRKTDYTVTIKLQYIKGEITEDILKLLKDKKFIEKE